MIGQRIWDITTAFVVAVVTSASLTSGWAQQEGREGGVAVGEMGDQATITTFNVTIDGSKSSLDNDLQRELLGELQQLISSLLDSGQLDASQSGSQRLAEGITEIAKTAPFSNYVLQGDQFTLDKTTGYFIEKTANLIAYHGYSGGFYSFYLDGEKETIRPGMFLLLNGEEQQCRLLLNGGEDFINEVDMTLLCP